MFLLFIEFRCILVFCEGVDFVFIIFYGVLMWLLIGYGFLNVGDFCGYVGIVLYFFVLLGKGLGYFDENELWLCVWFF